MRTTDWAGYFHQVYERAVSRYRSGERKPTALTTPNEAAFLASIGCTSQELFDFIEDGCQDAEPPFETVLLVTSVRRDYFLFVQQGQPSRITISMANLPPKSDEVDGIEWLPRIIAKARAKLRGEMPAELMYGCGGDRTFLHSVNVHAADFLREVWAAGGDDRRIIEFVKRWRALAKD